jgi:hypothetical protein
MTDLEEAVRSAHVRYASQDAVADALLRMGVGFGAAAPVWPPRRLPYGLFLSGVRNGWVSIWSPLDNTREWLPELTATLETTGVLLELIEGEFCIVELLRDGDLLGRLEMPGAAVEWDDLWARTADSLAEEGMVEPWEDEARFSARMDEIAASHEYREDLRRLREERPGREGLRPFLPPHASLDQAWELLEAVDRGDLDEEDTGLEERLEGFAGYLGIRDAAWSPASDLDALSEGDYEDEEGLPEGWRDFIVLPVAQLPVLD